MTTPTLSRSVSPALAEAMSTAAGCDRLISDLVDGRVDAAEISLELDMFEHIDAGHSHSVLFHARRARLIAAALVGTPFEVHYAAMRYAEVDVVSALPRMFSDLADNREATDNLLALFSAARTACTCTQKD